MINPESCNPNKKSGSRVKQFKTGSFIKKTCEGCKNNFNHTIWWKGKWLCHNCYKKETHLISFDPNNFKLKISEEQALNKIYKVKGYVNPNGTRSTRVSIPPSLIGKYFKIILVDEKEVPEKYRFKKLKMRKVKSQETKCLDIFPYGTSIEDVNKLNKKEILGEVEYDID